MFAQSLKRHADLSFSPPSVPRWGRRNSGFIRRLSHSIHFYSLVRFCKARCALWPCRISHSLRNAFFEATAPICPDLLENSLTLVFELFSVKPAFLQLASEPQNALELKSHMQLAAKPALGVFARAHKLLCTAPLASLTGCV